jgi:hypothetical protein
VGGVHATVVPASGVPLPDEPLVPAEPEVPASFDPVVEPLDAVPLEPAEPVVPLEPDLPALVPVDAPDVPVVDPLEAEPVVPPEPVEPVVVPVEAPEEAPVLDPLEPVVPPEPVEPAAEPEPADAPEETPVFEPLDWPAPLEEPLPDVGFDVPPVPPVVGASLAHATATTAPMARAAIDLMLRFMIKPISASAWGCSAYHPHLLRSVGRRHFTRKVRKKIRRLPFWADS